MSAASPRQQDPSMDEILASIRRIIADDQEAYTMANKPPPAGSEEDEVLDLAELEPSETAIADVSTAESPELTFQEEEEAPQSPLAASAAEDAPATSPSRVEPVVPNLEGVPSTLGQAAREGVGDSQQVNGSRGEPRRLISDNATHSVNRSFGLLSHTILTQNARTLEDLVIDMLKPMLRDWLDDNLPPLVERMVRTEIERVARGSR